MVKRTFDVLIALIVLIITIPLYPFLILLLLIFQGPPIFFTQLRTGKDLSIFTIFKLRTMYVANDNRGEVFNGNNDVTKVGKWLRRLKMDELPQIFNVLRGDMSLVGPRPLTPSVSDEIHRSKRFLVKPGMTGLAQVKGNIYLTREERVILDEEYVDRRNIFLDFVIIIKTILVVFFGEKRFIR